MIKQKTKEEQRAEAREMIFERVRSFEDRNNQKREYGILQGKEQPVSKQALYNYALSLLNTEFYKLPPEDRQLVLKQYE